MRTAIEGPLADTEAGAVAAKALRACVHCGMCNATCPTYQLAGDELEGPRGRIYLMKQALEGAKPTRLTLDHLDSCLTCRACETTCPSGVEYHRLLDIGREAVAQAVPRPWTEKLLREGLRRLTISPRLFSSLLALGRMLRPILPAALKDKLSPRVEVGERPARLHSRTMLMLEGCVQSAAAAHFNAATARVFDQLGITLVEAPKARCCGSVSFHLDAAEAARAQARANLDAWAALIDGGAEALIVNSSGCAAFIKDYPDLFRDDAVYLPLARRIASMMRDPIEVLESADMSLARSPVAPRIAVHEPCTLQHGLKLTGRIASLLSRLGYEPQPVADNHLCCGSAGAYSILHPETANTLKANKLKALNASQPAAVYTANIGCWMHLATGDGAPVRHWMEAVEAVLSDRP
ncbi:MAG: glycolate oxidase iron-sulfur subunit [Alphaproteobacteria bacterium PA2]|nr:MAG: glycolate oxidase iron-sulfur subunit [Alphaproteobacteria bacterium PA2]